MEMAQPALMLQHLESHDGKPSAAAMENSSAGTSMDSDDLTLARLGKKPVLKV